MTKLGYYIAGKVVEVKSKDDLINTLETNVIVLQKSNQDILFQNFSEFIGLKSNSESTISQMSMNKKE